MFRRNIVERIVRIMRTGESSISQEDSCSIELKSNIISLERRKGKRKRGRVRYLTMRDSRSFREMQSALEMTPSRAIIYLEQIRPLGRISATPDAVFIHVYVYIFF